MAKVLSDFFGSSQKTVPFYLTKPYAKGAKKGRIPDSKDNSRN
jgi:hypothetical protein